MHCDKCSAILRCAPGYFHGPGQNHIQCIAMDKHVKLLVNELCTVHSSCTLRANSLVAISFEGYSAQCSTATTVQYTALLSLSFFPSLSSPHNKLMDEERGGNETLAVSRGWRRRRGRRRLCCFPSTFPPLSFLLLLLLHSRNELRGGGGRLCLSLSSSSF